MHTPYMILLQNVPYALNPKGKDRGVLLSSRSCFAPIGKQCAGSIPDGTCKSVGPTGV